MITVSVILGAFVAIAMVVLWINGYRKRKSLQKILLHSTLLLFLFTLLLLISISYLAKQNKDSYVFGTNINDGLILFAAWYYFIPPIFLIVTVFAYLLRLIIQKK